MAMNLIEIHFDGGCRPTNPGNKYGSFEVLLNNSQVFKASRVEFGYGTNNEAEFDALCMALDWTVENLLNGGFDPSIYTVKMFTDSTILKNRIKNRRTTVRGGREPSRRMAKLTRKCLSKLTLFHLWDIEWHRRDSNVSRFGH